MFLEAAGDCTNSSTSPALNLIFAWHWGRLRGAVLPVRTELTRCSLGPCTGTSDLELCWLPGQRRAAGWLETGWLVLNIKRRGKLHRVRGRPG